MNVLTNVAPSQAETLKPKDRQDRGGSSSGSGSGFAETLGSLKERSPSSQTSSANAGTRSSDETQAASAGSGEQETPKTATVAPADQLPKETIDVLSQETAVSIPSNGLVSQPVAVTKPAVLPEAPADGQTPGKVEDVADALGDLVRFIGGLTKGAGTAAQSEATGEDTTEEKADSPDLPAVPTESADLLQLLAATATSKDQIATPAQQAPQASSAGDVGLMPAGLKPEGEGEASAATTVVRLSKQDAPAIDLHIDTGEDGTMKVDASLASQSTTVDVVQVVDSRRYLALSPTSNAANITAAMASDPEWATALTDQVKGAPLVTSTGQVVHTLKIQMNPVDLGHVTAALKLVGDELSVHLTAHTLKGYAELQKDGSSILDALKAQGFSVDQVTVSLSASNDRQDGGMSNRQPGDMQQQGAQQGSQRGNEDRSQEQFYRQPRARASEEANSNDITVQPEAPARGPGARPDHVYL